ncbi:MAG TPA: Rieske 2Fe-2S domain-containing protein [Candidatus Dormibacteraeota bacterium]|nr:Rieske 2Fe-2S domain-containing protein [Candidatus Dormibacteraeota bacterium]
MISPDATRVRIGSLHDLPLREGRAVTVAGERIAVFRCDGAVRAVSNACPHAGGPLADGVVAGDTVTCPLHMRVVDLCTGVVSDCAERVRVFDVVVEEGEIYLLRP